MIQGKKVILREKRLSDAPDDYLWRTDTELARYDAASPLQVTFEEFSESYQEGLRYPEYRRRRFAIDTLDGRHIGNCTYYDIDEYKRQAELGITIGDRNYWGQGYGSDAVVTLLRHVFANTKLERVYLHTLDWNIRAQRAFAKCGFAELEQVRYNGQTFVKMDVQKERWLRLFPSEESALEASG